MVIKVWQLAAAIALLAVGTLAGVYMIGGSRGGGTRTVVNVNSVAAPSVGDSYSQPDDAASNPAANIRAAIPAVEAYNADNGGYASMTSTGLRSGYDAAISTSVLVVRASTTDYCLESTVAGITFSKTASTDIAFGSC